MRRIYQKKVFSKGFSLIELMIVMGMLGIISSVVLALVNPRARIEAARNTSRKVDIATLSGAISAYTTTNGYTPLVQNPISLVDQDTGEILSCGAESGDLTNQNFLNVLKTGKYLKNVPYEYQSAGLAYVYIRCMNNTQGGSTIRKNQYLLYALLEGTHDSDCLVDGNDQVITAGSGNLCYYLFQNGTYYKQVPAT